MYFLLNMLSGTNFKSFFSIIILFWPLEIYLSLCYSFFSKYMYKYCEIFIVIELRVFDLIIIMCFIYYLNFIYNIENYRFFTCSFTIILFKKVIFSKGFFVCLFLQCVQVQITTNINTLYNVWSFYLFISMTKKIVLLRFKFYYWYSLLKKSYLNFWVSNTWFYSH